MKVILEIEDEKLDDFISLIQSIGYAHFTEEMEIPVWQQNEVLKRLIDLEKGITSKRNWDTAKLEIFKS